MAHYVIAMAGASLVACGCSGAAGVDDLFVAGRGNGPADSGAKPDGFTPAPSSNEGSTGARDQNDASNGAADRALGVDAIVVPPDHGNPPDAIEEPVVSRDAGDDAALDPGGPLRGQRWEVKCTTGPLAMNMRLCTSLPPGLLACPNRLSDTMVTFGGSPGTQYSVTVRLRGVVELKGYSGGATAGTHFQIGGTPAIDTINSYGLSVSSPAQTYYINADRSGAGAVIATLDDTVTIPIQAGATIELFATDTDCRQLRNCMDPVAAVCMPIVVPAVPPAPVAFDGQFAQIDVVSIVAQ